MKDGIPSPPPSTYVLFLLDVYVRFVCVYGCVPHEYLISLEAQKKVSDLLELELQTFVRGCHVGAGN